MTQESADVVQAYIVNSVSQKWKPPYPPDKTTDTKLPATIQALLPHTTNNLSVFYLPFKIEFHKML